MAHVSNWASIALAKLVTTYDKELFLDLDKEYFDGVYSPIFKVIQQHFSESQKLPSMETLEALVVSLSVADDLDYRFNYFGNIMGTSIDKGREV